MQIEQGGGNKPDSQITPLCCWYPSEASAAPTGCQRDGITLFSDAFNMNAAPSNLINMDGTVRALRYPRRQFLGPTIMAAVDQPSGSNFNVTPATEKEG